MPLKLVKTHDAVKSYALYNMGAKPAQWALVDDSTGATLVEIRGYTRGRTTSWTVLLDGKPMSLFSTGRDELVREAVQELVEMGRYVPTEQERALYGIPTNTVTSPQISAPSM